MRRKDREITNFNDVIEILETEKILRLGLFDGEFPYIVPLNYGFYLENEKIIFYTHGAKKGKKLDLILKNNKVFVEIESGVKEISGDENPCKYSTEYSSFMAQGFANIVENLDEKIKALKILMKTQTGKDFEFTEKMANFISILKIEIKNFSVKSNK